jgi:diguanylate cyclase (GGDEF)-like protein
MSTGRPLLNHAARRSVVLRNLALLSVPLLSLALMRLWQPLPLDASPLIAWAAPLAAAAVAVGAAGSMLVALIEGLRSGSAASFVNAAGKGVLAATYGVEAFAGPISSAAVPSGASAIGGALAGVVLVTGAVLGVRRVRVAGPRGQAVVVIAVFALTELSLALVSLGLSGGYRRPDETALRFLAAGLLALTAALVTTYARHVLSAAFLSVGTFSLAISRVGSADVLVALAALLAGMIVFIVVHLQLLSSATPSARHEAQPARLTADELPSPAEAEALEELQDEEAEVRRLARELRGTIDELAQARRVIELQRLELERAANIDPLSGAASRRAILERLRLEAAEARRYDHPLAVLLLDVDRLGAINAEHGVAVGDAVLREVALRMRLRIREADALGRADGGGFLALLPHTDERGAASFADTLRRRIAQRPFLVDGGQLEVRVSIGVAIVRPGTKLTDDEVLANADEALRSARAAGGDRIAFDRAHGLARIDDRRREPAPKPPNEAGQDNLG